jgi:cell division protein FtsA
VVLGSDSRASQGIKRGFVVDMSAATFAVREVVEKAEKMAGTSISSVWIGCSGAGLESRIEQVTTEIGERRIEESDIEQLLFVARSALQPDGRTVLHAHPASYTLDGANGVANPRGLHAQRMGVDIHVMQVDGAPVRNLTEAVQNAHLEVEGVVASPLAAGLSCLSAEERDLGVAMVEMGGEVTNVAVYHGGVLTGLRSLPFGSADIADAIATYFGIKRFQAERLKNVSGTALSSPADSRQLVPVNAPGEEQLGPLARHADDKNRVPLSYLVAVITDQLDIQLREIARALKELDFSGARGQQVVLTGGGAQLIGLADYAQGALARSVRIGRPMGLRGLAEAHSGPGFSTIAGLALFAAADPMDIRTLPSAWTPTMRYSGLELVQRVVRAVREYF